MLTLDLEVGELERALMLLHRVFCRAFFELGERKRVHAVDDLVLTGGHRLKDFNLDGSFEVIAA